MSDRKIQWHPGFVAAMDLELADNRADLVYEKEYNLNTKPLEIDLLVIKKDSDIRTANEISDTAHSVRGNGQEEPYMAESLVWKNEKAGYERTA